VHQVDIPLDPTPSAADGPATRLAKRRHLAASTLFALHIHIIRHSAPAAPERALGARGGKAGNFLAARGAHFADQVDIPPDPAPRAVHFLATNRAKYWHLAAPTLFALHIHIPCQSAPAASERSFGAQGGKHSELCPTLGAFSRH
jgi:hypothetical protein